MEECVTFHLKIVEIVLQPCVRVRIAVSKVIDVSLLVEAKCERHDIVLAMFWTSIVVDVPVWNPNPNTKSLYLLFTDGDFFIPTSFEQQQFDNCRDCRLYVRLVILDICL